MHTPSVSSISEREAGAAPRWFGWAVLCIVLVGLAAQATYLTRDYWHPDEVIAVGVSDRLLAARNLDTNWALADVTPLFKYGQYNFSSYHYLVAAWRAALGTLGLADSVSAAASVRLLNPFLGALAAVTLAFTMRRVAGVAAGLLAAAFLALDPLFVQDAHYGRCELMLATGIAVLLWLLAPGGRMVRRRTFLAGVALGWLVACKVTMVLGACGVPFLLLQMAGGWSGWHRTLVLGVIFGGGVLVGFGAGVPYGLLQPDVFLSGLDALNRYYSAGGPPYTLPGATTSYAVSLRYFLGIWGWGGLLALGLGVYGLWTSGRRWWLLGSVLPLLTVWCFFGAHPAFGERSYTPFLPFAKALAACGVCLLVDWIVRIGPNLRRYCLGLVLLLGAGVEALPLRYVSLLDLQVFSGRDLQEQEAAIRSQEDRFPAARSIRTALVWRGDFDRTLASIQERGPVLITVFDYGDLHSAYWSARLQCETGLREVGFRNGLFEDLPTCSLHTFHSARLRFLASAGLVDGGAAPAAPY